jgi:hypothetical protein
MQTGHIWRHSEYPAARPQFLKTLCKKIRKLLRLDVRVHAADSTVEAHAINFTPFPTFPALASTSFDCQDPNKEMNVKGRLS